MIWEVYSIAITILGLMLLSRRLSTPNQSEQSTIALMGNKKYFITGFKMYITHFNQG